MDESTNRDALEQALSRITDQELTRNERYGHVVLAAVGGIFAVGIISLLVTEPYLRQRALVAFLVMAGIGLAWMVYGVGVLVRHRPLLANREIVAGRMSVFFCALFTLGAMLAGFSVRKQVLYTGAVGLGLTMTAIALALLIRAHLRRASLRALRARLESELAGARM
jgi:hypothetical protein